MAQPASISKDREIERLALTQWDFGSFQDRGIINNILTIMVNTEFTLINQEKQSDFDAFKKIQKLRKEHENQAAKLLKLDSRFDHFPFYSCWFLMSRNYSYYLDIRTTPRNFMKLSAPPKA